MGTKQNPKYLLVENNTVPFVLFFAVLVNHIYWVEKDVLSRSQTVTGGEVMNWKKGRDPK